MKTLILTLLSTLLVSLVTQAQSANPTTQAVSGAPGVPCEGVCEPYKSAAPILPSDSAKHNPLLNQSTDTDSSAPGAKEKGTQ